MSWIWTHSGQRADPIAGLTCVSTIDIAHSLSRTCRFTGHVERYYSVAEHCCLVHDHVPERLRLLALLHDASEAYTADIASPIKRNLAVLMPDGTYLYYYAYEERILSQIYSLCGLQPSAEDLHLIDRADKRALATERDQVFATPPPDDWYVDEAPWPVCLKFWRPERAQSEWTRRYGSCLEARNAR